ncbi:DUF4112 domain-containing protein [Tessaracoccus sp. OH4464_COT-324]|uniref:DUF4112 domain-containing protein n=1 Tax=Tessaracoccus sp. OH4464_COT-324 TaxID=2491059 RepID=UPI000F643DD0|nr:DUF4112 domain-containing protein [Tessaracoccus sp. OH4464_COT-324]RRD47030.1 DUF4112 domain-containing protein [Tessaracoccus sp. OH4464_COT-324]
MRENKTAPEPTNPLLFSRGLTNVLENAVTIPGTDIRVGLDPVLSLVPWVGSSAGLLLGSAMMADAVRLRMPLPVLARMAANHLIDWAIGAVPVLGFFGDIAWRANSRNYRLLERTIADREQVRKASVRYWLAAAAIIGGVLLGTLLLTVWVLTKLLGALA